MDYIFEGLFLFFDGLGRIFFEKLMLIILFGVLIIILLIFQKFIRIKFKNKQQMYPRVRDALSSRGEQIKEIFQRRGVKYPPRRVYLRIFKEESLLELWACSKKRGPFTFIKDYEIISVPQNPGPKRQEGDYKIPEGFYYIDRFNPSSKYYMSLGLNYPNESDRILGVKGRPGGYVSIHGGIDTIDGITVTDDGIKELYIIALEAVAHGQDRIPVHIFPRRLNDEGYNELKEKYKNDYNLISFWDNIKEGFDRFEQNHLLPKITVNTDGKFIYRK